MLSAVSSADGPVAENESDDDDWDDNEILHVVITERSGKYYEINN